MLSPLDYRCRQPLRRHSLPHQLLSTLGIPAGTLARVRSQLAIVTFRLRQTRRVQEFWGGGL